MEFVDRLEIASGRLAQVAEELEAIANGREVSIFPGLAGLYAGWLRDLVEDLDSLRG